MLPISIDDISANYSASTVMIVDDQSVSLNILTEIVRNIDSDIQIRAFKHPLAALTDARLSPPDLIITDFKMPEMNGIEFTQSVRHVPGCKNVPVIMITIMDDKSTLHNALESGVNDFLNKPFDQAECKARCKNLLALSKHQSRLEHKTDVLQFLVNRNSDELLLREQETLNRLTRACEFKDCITGEHLKRIASFAHQISIKMGIDAERAEIIKLASPLHDVGKIAIADNILMKQGKLTGEEFTIMKSHTEIGYELLKDSPSPYLQTGAIIALNHHEKYNGKGYPNAIGESEIPIEARITAVADVFDSLTNQRPYKKAWPIEHAKEYLISEKGKHFDPACVDALLDIVNIQDNNR